MNNPDIKMAEAVSGLFAFVAIFLAASTGQPAPLVLGVAAGGILGWTNFMVIKKLVIKFFEAARSGRTKLGIWAFIFPAKLLLLAGFIWLSTRVLGASGEGLALGVSAVVAGIMAAMFYVTLVKNSGAASAGKTAIPIETEGR